MAYLLDIRHALRLLAKTPKFTGLTLFVLVGGLSISLYTFGFLYGLVYNPLPLPEGDSVRTLKMQLDNDRYSVPTYEFFQARDQLKSLEEFGAFVTNMSRLSIGDAGRLYSNALVEPNIFQFSRIEPVLGRGFAADDLLPGAAPTAVISYEIWQTDLRANPDIIGSEVRIDGDLRHIIGVMPPNYRFPNNTQIWLPLPESISRSAADKHNRIRVYLRLKDGITQAQAEQELTQLMNPIFQQGVKQQFNYEGELTAHIETFQKAQTDGQGFMIFFFFNLVATCILMLACINVGNLIMARAIQRQKETAIRAALGAPQWRLISQVMWEGVLITITGAILSTLLVAGALDYTDQFLRAFSPHGLSFWWKWEMNTPTLLMAVGFALLTIFVACFLPALTASRQDFNATLRDGTRGAQGKQAGRTSRILITAQVFLIAILLLIGSVAAFLSHFMLNIDIGENRDRLLRGVINISDKQYPNLDQQLAIYRSLQTQLRRQPNIEDVVVRNYMGEIAIKPDTAVQQTNLLRADVETVIGNTEFYGPYLIEGRHLNDLDNKNNRNTALVSQSFALRYFDGASALEKQFSMQIDGSEQRFTIVGIVTDQLNGSAMLSPANLFDEVYISGIQFFAPYQRIYFNHNGNEDAAENDFYRAVYDSGAAYLDIDLLSVAENQERMLGAMKLTSNLTFAAGAFALLLALTGIYGLTSNTVTQRTQEVGVRRALGAKDSQIILLFIRQGSRQLAIGLGLALGLFGLFALLFNQFTQVAFAPTMYFSLALLVGIGLSTVVLFAIYWPTKQAVVLEPSTALRYE